MTASASNGKIVAHQNGLSADDKGYCASLLATRTEHLESKDISDFCHLVQEASITWIDYVVEDFEKEAIGAATALGFSEILVKSLLRNQRSGYEDLGDEVGIILPAIIVTGFDVKLNPLLILVKENLIFTIHNTEVRRFSRIRRYAEAMLRKFPLEMTQMDRLTSLLIRLLDENNSRNFDYLREIEEQGDKLSEELADPKTSRQQLGQKIYTMKHALIIYLGGLWATVDALNSLRYGDANLLTDDPKLLNRMSGLLGEVNTQIGLAEHLSEVLASGLEVLQSIYNNQLQILNNRLALTVAYLTIVGTAVLVPNTLATILSGTMWQLSADFQGPYIILLVVSTVLATALAWWTVKRMGWLPKRPDTADTERR